VSEENILAKVNGPELSAALGTLPDPAKAAKDEIQEAVIDVPRLGGRIRITCEIKIARQGKNRRKFWSAFKAVRMKGG
jgi:hypothetical protein